jgi:tetratricopeptide (TPR) repeat protein
MALTHQGPEPQAIGYLRRALDLDPNMAEAHLWLGNLYFAALGQTRLAKRHWQQAESIAQRNGDQAMIYQIRLVKSYFLGRSGFPPPLIPGGPFDYPGAGFFDDDDYE